MTKYYSGYVYCPLCKRKWIGVAQSNVNLQCPDCLEMSGHMLDIDVIPVNREIIKTDNIIEFKRNRKPCI